MVSKIAIYDKNTIDQLPWPNTEWCQLAQKVLPSLVKLGSKYFFDNIDTTIKVLLIDDTVLPLAICEANTENSYVCSPYCHYVTYGLEHIATIKNQRLQFALTKLLKSLGKFLSFCQIDKNVFVNNWLVPTNLYPDLTEEQLKRITHELTKCFPGHAIIFRSVNGQHPQGLYDRLKKLKYSLVLSREIYLTDTTSEKPFKSRMFKSDLKYLNTSPYTITTSPEVLSQHVSRLKTLYSALNIDKYSKCNPQWNENFIKLAIDSKWMTFKALQKDTKIDAVFGYFSNGPVITSPFFGYDPDLLHKMALYRQISAQLLLDAKEQKKLLHQSSGAGHYKKLRRAKNHFEYLAVYHNHLKIKRRFPWMSLQMLINTFGKKFMMEG